MSSGSFIRIPHWRRCKFLVGHELLSTCLLCYILKHQGRIVLLWVIFYFCFYDIKIVPFWKQPPDIDGEEVLETAPAVNSTHIKCEVKTGREKILWHSVNCNIFESGTKVQCDRGSRTGVNERNSDRKGRSWMLGCDVVGIFPRVQLWIYWVCITRSYLNAITWNNLGFLSIVISREELIRRKNLLRIDNQGLDF